jgi:hypothetical protein
MSRTRHQKPRVHVRTVLGSWLLMSLMSLAAVLWGCGGGGSTPTSATIDKEKFITTYVQLRQAVVKVDSAGLDSARAAILRRAGVTQQEMLAFADVHGRDVAFMKGVWDEVERRLREQKPDSTRAH